jgi:hypothetical protein
MIRFCSGRRCLSQRWRSFRLVIKPNSSLISITPRILKNRLNTTRYVSGLLTTKDCNRIWNAGQEGFRRQDGEVQEGSKLPEWVLTVTIQLQCILLYLHYFIVHSEIIPFIQNFRRWVVTVCKKVLILGGRVLER